MSRRQRLEGGGEGERSNTSAAESFIFLGAGTVVSEGAGSEKGNGKEDLLVARQWMEVSGTLRTLEVVVTEEAKDEVVVAVSIEKHSEANAGDDGEDEVKLGEDTRGTASGPSHSSF